MINGNSEFDHPSENKDYNHKTKHGKAQTDTHRWKEERGRHDMLRIMIYDFNKWLLTLISYFHYVLANTYTFNIWHLKQKSASGGKKKHKVNAGAGKVCINNAKQNITVL